MYRRSARATRAPPKSKIGRPSSISQPRCRGMPVSLLLEHADLEQADEARHLGQAERLRERVRVAARALHVEALRDAPAPRGRRLRAPTSAGRAADREAGRRGPRPTGPSAAPGARAPPWRCAARARAAPSPRRRRPARAPASASGSCPTAAMRRASSALVSADSLTCAMYLAPSCAATAWNQALRVSSARRSASAGGPVLGRLQAALARPRRQRDGQQAQHVEENAALDLDLVAAAQPRERERRPAPAARLHQIGFGDPDLGVARLQARGC